MRARDLLRTVQYDKYLYFIVLKYVMWPFKRKSNVDATTLERIEKLEKDVSKLKTECLDNATDIDAMRDKVLRKIQKKREEPEEEVQRPGLLHWRKN